MSLTDEAKAMFADHIAQWFDRRDVLGELRTKVFDPTIKPQAVVKIRDELIWWLRTRCWQTKVCMEFQCDFLAGQDDNPSPQWQPLSYPNIAEVLHLKHHTTVMCSLKRTRKKLEQACLWPGV